jgi:hypothetical protein
MMIACNSVATGGAKQLARHPCRLRVKTGPDDPETGLPKYPRKQTFPASVGMSQTCQQATSRRQPIRPCTHKIEINQHVLNEVRYPTLRGLRPDICSHSKSAKFGSPSPLPAMNSS